MLGVGVDACFVACYLCVTENLSVCVHMYVHVCVCACKFLSSSRRRGFNRRNVCAEVCIWTSTEKVQL